MAVSAPDALTISGYLRAHDGIVAGADDIATIAKWVRSRWGGTGSDSQVIAKYAEARSDPDLVAWALSIRRNGDGRA